MEETRRLAEFASRLAFEDLPSDVVDVAKDLILDSLGVQVAASTTSWSKSALRYVRSEGGEPSSTVVNYGLRTSPGLAAFVNGAFAHGIEMDDVHPASAVHGGPVVVPSALAVAEKELASGRDLIAALVAGYELMVRIGLAVTVTIPERGQHNPSVTGTVGAAAIAGHLLRFDVDTMHNALAIAAGNFVGIQEHTQVGGHAKRTYPGMAAFDGIRAALLARQGLTGPVSALEGRKGLCRVLSDQPDFELLTTGLGARWTIQELMFKIYASVGFIQPMLECVEEILARDGVTAGDIRSVEVRTNSFAISIASIPNPEDLTAAQFSAQFAIALLIVKGSAMHSDYTEEALHDPLVTDLAKRVHLVIDDRFEQTMTRTRGSQVMIKLRSGGKRTHRIEMLRKLGRDEVQGKFRKLSAGVLEGTAIEDAVVTIASLEELHSIPTLMKLVVAKRPSGR